MPQREVGLIKLFADAATEYSGSHAVNKARDIRLEVQIRALRFMRESQQVQDWVGVVKTRGTTPEGDAWISVEIADGVTLSTWKTNADDAGATTLFRPGSKLFSVIQTAKIGQSVKFSGAFLSLAAASDEDMILRPQFIMVFTDIKSADG